MARSRGISRHTLVAANGVAFRLSARAALCLLLSGASTASSGRLTGNRHLTHPTQGRVEKTPDSRDVVTRRALMNEAQSGDLVFRRGRSFGSVAVAAADPLTEFTHVGIVVIGQGRPLVVHVEPGDGTDDSDRVRLEPLDVFTAIDAAVEWALYRPVSASERTRLVAGRAAMEFWRQKLRFDTAFDLASPEAIYCTELVWRVYSNAGLDLRAKRAADLQPAMGSLSRFLFPRDLYESSHLRQVLSVKEEK